MKFFFSLATVAIAVLPLAIANDRIPGSMFRNDPHGAAMAAVPMWHFGRPRGMVRPPEALVMPDLELTSTRDHVLPKMPSNRMVPRPPAMPLSRKKISAEDAMTLATFTAPTHRATLSRPITL